MANKERTAAFGSAYWEQNNYGFKLEGDGFKLGREYVGDRYERNPGGSALYFTRVCASLGLEALFIGKIGNDSSGDELIKMLESEGVATAFVRSSNHQTNTAINFITIEGKSTQFVNGDANPTLSPEEVESKFKKSMQNIDYLYLGGAFKLKKFTHAYSSLAKVAQSKGIKIILDHGRIDPAKVTEGEKQMMRQLVGQVDYYFPSRDEFCELWGADTIEGGLHIVRPHTKAVIAIKDEENGSFGLENNHVFQSPAFPVANPQYTVGAGDSFNAGFIRARSLDMDIKDSLRFANATAALKISHSKLPTFQEVKELLVTPNGFVSW